MSRHEWPGAQESLTRGFGETFHRTWFTTMGDVLAGAPPRPVVRPIVHRRGREAHGVYSDGPTRRVSNREAAGILSARITATLKECE